jgi:hypothetical protein
MDMNVTNPKTKAAHAALACRERVVNELQTTIHGMKFAYVRTFIRLALELGAYQDGCIFGANVQVDGADADSHKDINQEPQPVIPKIT